MKYYKLLTFGKGSEPSSPFLLRTSWTVNNILTSLRQYYQRIVSILLIKQ